MAKILGSVLHGAYGDLYEQALCLKHYALTHPETELRLFAATPTRLEAFAAVDLSFAKSFSLWTAIEEQPEIERFFQFQAHDGELRQDVLEKLSPSSRAKFDMSTNHLPWRYMRDHALIPERGEMTLPLAQAGQLAISRILADAQVAETIWSGPTVSFLWRYRQGAGAISSVGQKSEQEMVAGYSSMFRELIAQFGCHVLVFGMNVATDDTNRVRTDNKYPSFGLELPENNVTYFKGLSWPVELEIASRATVCSGHPSGFTEGLWLKRGRDTVLIDPLPHYLAKIAYHRMPLFGLNNPVKLGRAFLMRSPAYFGRQIANVLRKAGNGVEPQRPVAPTSYSR